MNIVIDSPFLPEQRVPRDAVWLDCRFRLDDPVAGRRLYEQDHIPGASYVDLEQDLSGPRSSANEGRHPLPMRNTWRARVGALGIGVETPVVVYDDQGGLMAARAWWLLRWLGHEPVWILSGGYPAWTGPRSAEPASVTPTDPYPGLEPDMIAVDALRVESRGERLLLDARAPARFRGEQEPIDPVAGHIPDAVNLPVGALLTDEGHPRSAGEIRNAIVAAGARIDQVGSAIASCGSGVTACALIALLAHAGIEGPALYAGSWSDWIAKALPVATGE